MFETFYKKFIKIVKQYNCPDELISISVVTLTPEEAIGNPEDKDYPILKGKERMIQAVYKNSKGVAFTDHYGFFKGTLYEILDLDFKTTFERSILVATANAVLKSLNLIERTSHCKDSSPRKCSKQLTPFLKDIYPNSKNIALIGLQPRLLEGLIGGNYNVRVVDLDKDNINLIKSGVKIEGPESTKSILNWCDTILTTGSAFLNEGAELLGPFLDNKNMVIYGVTGVSIAHLFSISRFCPESS